jgi:hypothetical protein
MKPVYEQMLGLKEVTVPGTPAGPPVINPAYTDWMSKWGAGIPPEMVGTPAINIPERPEQYMPGTAPTPPTTKIEQMTYAEKRAQSPEEYAAQEKQLLLQGIYVDPQTGATSQATEEQMLGGMTPIEQMQYQVSKSNLERTQLAQQGKLPIPEVVQNQINQQQRIQQQQLAEQLGPNWAMSTPGQNLATQQNLQTNTLLSAVSQGQLDASQALEQINANIAATSQAGYGTTVGQLGGLGQLEYANMMGYPSRQAGMIGQYGAAASPLSQMTANQYTAALQQQAINSQLFGSALGTAGMIGMAAMLA